ncbi:MAG: PAS domain-containing protein, partial [Burkholderiaceae bacterium]|nr:PAS domain-containing protein [Burkholderiaceae bacterium]
MAGHTPTPEHALELQLLHQRLHEADQRLQALGRNLPGSVIYQMVRDADGRRYFAYMGEAIEAIVGLKAEDVLRDAAVLYRRILPEDMPAFLALADQSYHELCTVQTQARLRRMDGEVRWMRMASTPRALEHGGVIWDGLLTDITEQIRAEAVTRAYENQLAGVLRHLPGAVARIGLDLEVLYANDTQARWVDSTVEQMIGRRMPEFITPGLMDRMLPFLRRAMNGETVVFENRIDRPDGEVRFRHTTLVPERTAQGAVAAVVLFAYDLTELKKAQHELSQQKMLLASLIQAMPDVVFLKDAQGVYLACNPVFERFIGRPAQEILGRTDADLMPAAAAQLFVENDQRALQAWQPLVFEETVTFAADGYQGQFETIKTPIRDPAGRATGVLGVSR